MYLTTAPTHRSADASIYRRAVVASCIVLIIYFFPLFYLQLLVCCEIHEGSNKIPTYQDPLLRIHRCIYTAESILISWALWKWRGNSASIEQRIVIREVTSLAYLLSFSKLLRHHLRFPYLRPLKNNLLNFPRLRKTRLCRSPPNHLSPSISD